MGRIVEYVVLLSSLSLTLGSQQYPRASQGVNYEREKRENFTHVANDREDVLSKRVLPPQSPPARRKLSHMLTSVGLHAYAVDDDDIGWSGKRKNSSQKAFPSPDSTKRNLSAFSQRLQPQRSSRHFYSEYYPSQKLSRLSSYNGQDNQNSYGGLNSPKSYSNQKGSNLHGQLNTHGLNGDTLNHKNYQNGFHNSHKNHSASTTQHTQFDPQNKRTDGFNRRRHSQGRVPRYHPKICDSCNSVPWVPLLKVPDSYRQQRTHITELQPTPQQSFHYDFHAYPTTSHSVLLPPVPLPPPIFDSTVSSSFGLPIGNIPTGHGLLAPIATEITNYAIDYGNPFNYYSPPALLDAKHFPELSPVPIVPVHDSGQFFHVDNTIPDLVPPTKPIDVSNVVLTISEQEPTDLRPPNHKYPAEDLPPKANAVAALSQPKHQHNKDLGKLEIVKSIPIAEFTQHVNVPQQQQELPLYPPLQSEYSNDFHNAEGSDYSSDSSYLVPPVNNHVNFHSNDSSDSKAEYLGEASAPKPLTSPSLSWLFSDHTSPPSDSKGTESASSFVTDAQEIASAVNNELRPVPTPKSKKIQIIIPYTTKGKASHDSNAFESVQHEVYQSPTNQTLNRDEPVYNDARDNHNARKYLNEMHHIIATNLRDLLREEIEKSQNYPLQNNIDNWTALEYSNHKTVESKAPKDVIAQALSVTSIPGTSISHLLLPSKKIPNEYFVTTPLPAYDEPSSLAYRAENSTVNSRPFTARPYATTNIYNPLPNNTARTTKPTSQSNHDKTYTELERERVNAWKRINENLVLPEARARTTAATGRSNVRYIPPARTEKVQIVTPVSVTSQSNDPVTPTVRRTTRHTHAAAPPTARTRKPMFMNRMNSTKLEKVSNQNFPFNRKFTYNSTTRTTTTTVAPTTASSSQNLTAEESSNNSNKTAPDTENGEESAAETKEELEGSPNKGDHVSINDIFPFRNRELPWEKKQNGGPPNPRAGRQRNSLIKQANLQKSRTAATSS